MERSPMSQRPFRNLFVLACLFTIGGNSYFLMAGLIHFGGRMDYAPFAAETLIYRDMEGRDPQGHEVYFKHEELLNGPLIIKWHDNWKEKIKTLIAQPKSVQPFYFLTWEDPDKDIEKLEKDGHKTEFLGSVNALDAPPPVFHVLRRIFKDRSDRPLKLFVFKVTD